MVAMVARTWRCVEDQSKLTANFSLFLGFGCPKKVREIWRYYHAQFKLGVFFLAQGSTLSALPVLNADEIFVLPENYSRLSF